MEDVKTENRSETHRATRKIVFVSFLTTLAGHLLRLFTFHLQLRERGGPAYLPRETQFPGSRFATWRDMYEWPARLRVDQ